MVLLRNPGIFILLGCGLLAGCGSAKRTEQIVRVERDTVRVFNERIIEPRIVDRVVVDQICDTITNEVIRFEKEIVIGDDRLKVTTDQYNQLIIEIERLQKIIKDTQNKETVQVRETEVTERTSKKRLPTGVIIGLVVGGIIAALYLYRRLL